MSQFYFDLFLSIRAHTLCKASDGLLMPGTASEQYPQWPCSLTGHDDSQSTPPTHHLTPPPSSFLPSSTALLLTSSLFFFLLLLHLDLFYSQLFLFHWSFPTIILLFLLQPAHKFPLSFLPQLSPRHPCINFPSRAVLSPAFRPETGFGYEPGHEPHHQHPFYMYKHAMNTCTQHNKSH